MNKPNLREPFPKLVARLDPGCENSLHTSVKLIAAWVPFLLHPSSQSLSVVFTADYITNLMVYHMAHRHCVESDRSHACSAAYSRWLVRILGSR